MYMFATYLCQCPKLKEKGSIPGIFICAQGGFIFLCVGLGWDGGGGSLLRLVKRLYRCLPFNFL